MRHSELHFKSIISLALAVLLTLMPLPLLLQPVRPYFVLLSLMYWLLHFNEGIGVIYAFSVGLLCDIFFQSLLGQNAFAFAVIAYLMHKVHLRLRLFPFWQQFFVIGLFIGVYQILMVWIEGTIGHEHPISWLPLCSSIVMWPLVSSGLNSFKRR